VRALPALPALAALALLTGCGNQAPPAPPAPAETAAPPRPLVLLLPGSGFQGAGEAEERTLSIRAAVWEEWGLEARIAAYGRGRQGAEDAVAAVRAARAEDPRRAICLYGESSGGTWALLAATRVPGVTCVVAAAAPTDEETWLRSRPREAQLFARVVWPRFFGGPREDDRFEPLDAWRAARPGVPVALLYATGDRIVPPAQGRVMAGVTNGPLRVLPPGEARFVHGGVDAAALDRALAETRAFVARAVSG